MAPENAPAIADLDELLAFREKTERISSLLSKRLKDHVSALSPLLSPGRVFGKHIGARDNALRADEAFAELTEKYKQACVSPLDLKEELDEEVLTRMGTAIQVCPFEYDHEAQAAGKPAKKISMTSPVRWVAAYGTECPLSQLRALTSSTTRRTGPVRQFVVNALAFQIVLARSAAATQLLADLRWQTSVAVLPGIEKLPLATFSIALPSFRPADELLLTATRLSGVPAFIELIDAETVGQLEDPLRKQLEASVR
jgi:hypothetical protein